MSSVDNRVVKMEFQNSDFEKNLKTSEESLKKFQNTLSGLSDSKISSNLENIASKFSTLGIVGVTALQNITNQAIDTGKTLVKSLTTDNILSGWTKLEEQTKAVGTLVSQGLDVDYVTQQLQKLQWYTDETSYNFNDMLTAASRFTATGQTLDASITTLQGIANWAAVSGQNATAASSAMRELAQAAGRGYLTLQDWSSIQTLMMDNTQVRDIILDTAVSMGTLQKNTDGTYRSLVALTNKGFEDFEKSQMMSYLTTGRWFTTDVLVETMRRYAAAVDPVYEYVNDHNVTAAEAIESLDGVVDNFALTALRAAQEARTLGDALGSVREGVASSWQTTFGIILGDYKEQRKLWTDLADRLYDVFVVSGETRNDILREWADLGGREKLLQGLWNIFDGIVQRIEIVKTAFRSIFPPKTADDLMSLTEKFESFTSKLVMSDETATKVGRTLQGVFSILKLGRDILYAIIKPIASLIGSSGSLTDSILTITQAIGDAITNFVHWVEESEKLKVASNAVSAALAFLGRTITVIFGTGYKIIVSIKDAISDISKPIIKFEKSFDKASESVTNLATGLGLISDKKSYVVDVARAYSAAVNVFDDDVVLDAPNKLNNVSDAFSKLGFNIKSKYETYIKPAFDGIINFLSTNIFNSGLISGLIKILGIIVSFKFVWGIADLIIAIPRAIAGVIKILGSLGNILSGLAMSLKGSAYIKYAVALGLVVAGLWALSKIDVDEIFSHIGQIIVIFEALNAVTIRSVASLWLLSKINLTPFIVSMALIAAAIYGIYKISPLLEKIDSDIKEAFGEENIKKIFDFIGKVSDAIKGIAGIALTVGITRFLNSLTSIVKTAANFKLISVQVFNKDTSWQAKMLKFTAGLSLVAVSVIALGKTNIGELEQGGEAILKIAGVLVGIQVLISILDLISGFIGKKGGLSSTLSSFGSELLKVSFGIGVISLALVMLGKLNQNEINQGISALGWLAVGFVGLSAATKLIGEASGKQILSIGFSIIGIATGMIILSGALKILSTIDSDSLLSSTLAIIGALASMTLALSAVSAMLTKSRSGWNMIGIAFAFDMLAASLMMISVSIISLSNLAWEETISGAGALGIALVSMAGALAIVGNLVGFLKSMGAVIALAGMAVVVLMLSKAFQDFSSIETGKLWSIVGAISAMIAVMSLAVGALSAVANFFPIGGAIVIGVLVAIAAVCLSAGYSIKMIVNSIESLALVVADRGADISRGIELISTSIGNAVVYISESIAKAMLIILEGGSNAVVAAGKALVNGFKEIRSMVLGSTGSMGQDIIEGISSGMKNTRSSSLLVGAAQWIISKINDGLDRHSPPPWSIDAGSDISEGIGIGIEGSSEYIKSATSEIINSMTGLYSKGGTDNMNSYLSSFSSTLLNDKSSTNSMTSFFEKFSDEFNWAASNYGSSLAEAVVTPYSEKLITGLSLVSEYVSTHLSSNAADLMNSITPGLQSLSSSPRKSGISENLSKIKGSAQNASDAMEKSILYNTDLNVGLGRTAFELSKSNKELRSFGTTVSKISENINPNMLSDIENLRRKIRALFSDTTDSDITPVVNAEEIERQLSSRDYNIDVKANIDSSEVTKSLNDYELSLEELVRKYGSSSISKVNKNGEEFWTWAYNGPMGGVIDENTEWVYEGPLGGIYDPNSDKFYGEISNKLVELENWTSSYEKLVSGFTNDTINTIISNSSDITSAIEDQTSAEARYNSDILSFLNSLSSKLDDVDSGISGLSGELSNLGIYLDGKTLVGELSPQIDKTLGNRQKLVSMGVYR